MSFGLFGVHNFDIKGSLYDGSTSDVNNKLTTRQYVADAIAASGGEWFTSVLEQTNNYTKSSPIWRRPIPCWHWRQAALELGLVSQTTL